MTWSSPTGRRRVSERGEAREDDARSDGDSDGWDPRSDRAHRGGRGGAGRRSGAQGEGRIGAGLAKAWPATDPAAYIRQVVADGIAGTSMPAWSGAKGGPLSDEQIANVAAYILPLSPPASATPGPGQAGPIGLTAGLIGLAILALLVIVGLVVYYRRA